MTSSNGSIFFITGSLCGEFTGPGEFPAQRPVTRSFDAFFDLRPNKRLSKQPWGWWFETSSWSLWPQCNGTLYILQMQQIPSHRIIHWFNSIIHSMNNDVIPFNSTGKPKIYPLDINQLYIPRIIILFHLIRPGTLLCLYWNIFPMV